ncbi:MAG: hypothetical protein A3F11_04315 [Gammaproteobacteria bacterium RIFCSPHIGHO2_12_FULL_37_14]|nr:MAG: hypothetical protein A3F11_04315 [Gammaproteobacteria bacterium RIFCSPHIGHO2_12_FULL_37_14]
MIKHNKENYSLPVGESDLERMTMLGSIYDPFCYDFLFENGLKSGLKIADVGCGPGNATLWLAEQVGVTGKVIGIDRSDEQLAILNRKILEKDVANISSYKADIYEINQIKESFDLVFCRFLFIHLSYPLAAIKKLKSLLKPGGSLIIAELDNSTWFSYPEHEALRKDTELLCATGGKKEMDFCIGLKLYGYLRKENFNFINLKIAQPILFGNNRNYLLLKSKAWAKSYFDYGFASKTDLNIMTTRLKELIHNDEYLIGGAKMYLASGKN